MAKDRNAEPLLEPLSARSVVASLLLGMHPPRLSAARLVRWCGVFGIAQGTARVALSRMVERGELAGADGVYELVGPVRARQRVQDWNLDPDAAAWDESWRMGAVVAAARDAAERAALRDAMRRLRYAHAREGLWVRPANLPRASGPEDAWAVADAQCDWWTATPERDARVLAAELFDPAAWAARAAVLLRQLERATASLRAPSDADLARAFEAGAAVLTHVRADPLLPTALCPARWPGDRLREAYTEYQRAFGTAVREWFRAEAQSPAMERLLDAAAGVLPDAVALRRRIHAEPELGLELPHTQAEILAALDGLGLEISTGTSTTSVVADLHGAEPGPTILLRADMDALPMPEDTGAEFASTIAGTMHACGHDAHVAMLVGAARILAARRDLPGTVRFAFQPGEEGFGGARYMIDEGLLDDPNVDAAFAIHVAPNLPSGSLWTRPGALMASADVLDIKITGKGGHASTPYLARDPIPVAAEMIQALQTFVTRGIDTFDPVVITITYVRAGTTTNVIPEDAHLRGTLRTVSPRGRRHALAGIERVVAGIAAAHDQAAVFIVEPGYPPTINDDDFAGFALDVATEVLGAANTGRMPAPVMGAEDFSYVLEQRPGALAFLGVCPPGVRPSDAHACHSNRMQLDEDAMQQGIAVHCAVAERFLTRDLA